MTNLSTGKILTDFIVVQSFNAVQVQIHLLEYKCGDRGVNCESWYLPEYKEDIFTLLHQKANERVEKFNCQRRKRIREASNRNPFTRPDVISGKKVRLSYSFKKNNGSKCLLTAASQQGSRIRDEGYRGYNIFPEKLIAYAYPLDGYLRIKQLKDIPLTEVKSRAFKNHGKRQAAGAKTTSSHYFQDEKADLSATKHEALCKMMKNGKSKTQKKTSEQESVPNVNVGLQKDIEANVSRTVDKITPVETLMSVEIDTDLKTRLMSANNQAVLTGIKTAASEKHPLGEKLLGQVGGKDFVHSASEMAQSSPSPGKIEIISCKSKIPDMQSDPVQGLRTRRHNVSKGERKQGAVIPESEGSISSTCSTDIVTISKVPCKSSPGTVQSKRRKRVKEKDENKPTDQILTIATDKDFASGDKSTSTAQLLDSYIDKAQDDMVSKSNTKKPLCDGRKGKRFEQEPHLSDSHKTTSRISSMKKSTKNSQSSCGSQITGTSKVIPRRKICSKLSRLKHSANTTQQITRSQQRSKNLMQLADEFELGVNLINSSNLSLDIGPPIEKYDATENNSSAEIQCRRESGLPLADFISQDKNIVNRSPDIKGTACGNTKNIPRSPTSSVTLKWGQDDENSGQPGLGSASPIRARSPTPPPLTMEISQKESSNHSSKHDKSTIAKNKEKLTALFGSESDSPDGNIDLFKPNTKLCKGKRKKNHESGESEQKKAKFKKNSPCKSTRPAKSDKNPSRTSRKKIGKSPVPKSKEKYLGPKSRDKEISPVAIAKPLKFRKSDKTPPKRKSLDMRTLMEKYKHWPDNQPTKPVNLSELTKSQERSKDNTENVEDIFQDCLIQEEMSTPVQVKLESDVEMSLERQLKQISDVKEISEEQMHYFVRKHETYLRDIFQGKTQSRRHADYKQGGLKRVHLSWQIPLALFDEEQTDYIMDALRDIFCKQHNKYLDYLMRVLLPEILIKLVMEIYNKSYSETEKLLEDI